MRGISDQDKEAMARWEKSVASAKERRLAKRGKVKTLIDKYLKKFHYINPKGVSTFQQLTQSMKKAKSRQELEEWGEVANKIKMSASELRKLMDLHREKRIELGRE